MATAKKSAPPTTSSTRKTAAKKAAPAKAPLRKTASAKPAVKPAAKAPAKPVAAPAPAPAPAAAPVTRSIPPAKAAKTEKPKKPKLVRDSFTIPKAEYTVLDTLKQRAAKAGLPAKKSEVLRAGIKALAALSDAGFAAAMAAVPTVKTGRPAKD